MKPIEKQLLKYGNDMLEEAEEEKAAATAAKAKEVFFAEAERMPLSYFDFLFQQTGYIKKRWWLLQAGVLVWLWWLIHDLHTELLLQRVMGILAAVFGALFIPELWKNRTFKTMEIEIAAYYSLRQIYAARMLVFAVVDGILLSVFAVFTVFTTSVRVEEMLFHFLLPLVVTCGILFGTLCSRYHASEFTALFLALLGSAGWMLVVVNNQLYQRISLPVWEGILFLAAGYLVYAVRRVIATCDGFWEVSTEWN